MEEIIEQPENSVKGLKNEKYNDISYEEISNHFQEYFNNLTKIIQSINYKQQLTLKKKYRYFLTKLMKLQQIESNLILKHSNLEQIAQNSIAVMEQKKSIQFINMISTQTMKKLQILGKKVNQSKQIKKKNEKQMHYLRDLVTKQKNQYFKQKKEEIMLKEQIDNLKKQEEITMAEIKFKTIVENKKKNRTRRIFQSLKPLNNQFRFSEDQSVSQKSKNGNNLSQYLNTITSFQNHRQHVSQIQFLKKNKNFVQKQNSQFNKFQSTLNSHQLEQQEKSLNNKLLIKNVNQIDDKNTKNNTQISFFNPSILKKRVQQKQHLNRLTQKGKSKKLLPIYLNKVLNSQKLYDKKSQKQNILQMKKNLIKKQINLCQGRSNVKFSNIIDNKSKKIQEKQIFLKYSPQQLIEIFDQNGKICELAKFIEENFQNKKIIHH